MRFHAGAPCSRAPQLPVQASQACSRSRPKERRIAGRCATAVAQPGVEMVRYGVGSPRGPDLVLSVPDTEATVHVFCIDHRHAHPHVGEFILRERPDMVVVETPVTQEHGSLPGNTLSCKDQVVEGTPQAFFVRMFCQVAAQLRESGGDDPASSAFWQQIKGVYLGEQLAYITAFATGASLVYADRPKDISYRRLFALASAADLDEGFGAQCEDLYCQVLGLPAPSYSGREVKLAERILMQEREAVMCKVLDDACRTGLLQGGPSAPAKSVVMVVGRSHMHGIRDLWEGARWAELVASDDVSSSPLMAVPPAPSEDEASREAGVRRGLLHAVMRMLVTGEVMDDMETVLGPVPARQVVAVQAIEEIYGSSRMMLATLPHELLQQVVGGLDCGMWDVLAPCRELRASNGGAVYSEETVMELRSLNFDLPDREDVGVLPHAA
ncbi:hypothetical protein FOA52_013765 [Chlamydomonas sp. UWO 241]|nr:hypothetical protein FOA52_013765 [Chlamydomonas sp. UWO 241]